MTDWKKIKNNPPPQDVEFEVGYWATTRNGEARFMAYQAQSNVSYRTPYAYWREINPPPRARTREEAERDATQLAWEVWLRSNDTDAQDSFATACREYYQHVAKWEAEQDD